jgi:hypothetical protein
MSTRSFGQVGKTYNTASEAFKDASYAYSIEPPMKDEYSPIWSLLGVLTVLGIVAYLGFTRF